MGRARDIANVLSSSTNIALDSELGLSLITPTSITATGGSGSISSTGAVTFTGASTVSINGVFSATYRNYKIIGHFLCSANDPRLDMRLRASGTDNSTANYSSGQIVGPYSASLSNSGQTAQTIWNAAGLMKNSTEPTTFHYDFFSPFETENTNFTLRNTRGVSGQTLCSGLFNATTSFDSLTFIPEGGTMTGTVYVYGYRK